ncbi:MAG: hypothetical protein ACKOYC_08170 [Bacteroidota bacterium]
MPLNPELLLKPMISWFSYHQSVALNNGVKLKQPEKDLALSIGCDRPDKIRIVHCNDMPTVKSQALLAAFTQYEFNLGDATGLCLGYGIFIHRSQKGDGRILAHELTHTLQYERFGGTSGFLNEYISQFLKFGYHQMPLEKEARANEKMGAQLIRI